MRFQNKGEEMSTERAVLSAGKHGPNSAGYYNQMNQNITCIFSLYFAKVNTYNDGQMFI